MSSNLTLSQYLQQQNGNLTPELAQVIETIADTCKTIDQALQKGALAGILGSAVVACNCCKWAAWDII